MEYNFENTLSPEQEYNIKEMLYQKYAGNFEEIGIKSIEQMEICNMAELIIDIKKAKKDPLSLGDESNYRRNEHLRNIYAVMNKNADEKDNKAVLINLSKEGKMPEGEFGIYDFNTNKFEASTKVKDEIIKNLKIVSLSITKQDEILNTIFKDKDSLDSMNKLATMDLEKVIEAKITEDDLQKLISEKIDEENKENGKSPDDRAKIEKEENTKDQKDNEEKETKDLVSPTMMKQAYVLGYTKVKGVVLAKGAEASNKLKGTAIDKNAGDVTIIRFAGDSVGKESDKFLIFQGDRLVVPGNKDEEIDKLLGTRMQNMRNGTMADPLKIEDEEQFLEYNENGMSIEIKLDEGKDLSVEDLEEYKKRFKEIMEQYFIEIYKIENDPTLKTDAEKDRLYLDANERFNIQNADAAKECNINFDDMKEVNLITDERTEEQVNKEQDDDYDIEQQEHMARVNNNRKK